MPERKTIQRAAQKKTASGKTGEFVREEMDHIREGKHGARSTKQAIAIGLSKARRAGVKIPPAPGAKETTKKSTGTPSPKRSRATLQALEKEGTAAASPLALSRHAHAVARQRGPAARSASAKKAAKMRAREN
jgi:hypothetical protein